jgi:Terminase large subunit, T4likevirus-type, N-terminal
MPSSRSQRSWRPRLTPKQELVYDSKKRLVLAVGARGSGKTWGIEHKIVRHAWRTNPCRVAIICKTTRAGSLGVWPELCGTIYSEWEHAGIGSEHADFGYAVRPRQDNITKIRYFKLWNHAGGHSEVILFPVERSADALDKLLSTQFSYVWISEAHLYEDRRIFDVARGQLRLAGVPFAETGLICDCNPPEEGTNHWLYDVFYRERDLAADDFPSDWDLATRQAFIEQQSQMEVFEFKIEDNCYLDPGLEASFRSTYARNARDYRRLVSGMWVGDDSLPTGCFARTFSRVSHVLGSTEGSEDNWEVLAPGDTGAVHRQDGRPLLLSGWDIGGGANHAWVALQPRDDARGKVSFDVLDELVVIGQSVSVEQFTADVLEAMKSLRQLAGFTLNWIHYSDASAQEFRAAIRKGTAPADDAATDAGSVESVSKGEVELIGCGPVKKPGWQRRRVQLIQQLLAENRLRISAHCRQTVQMFERLRVNTSRTQAYLAPGQEDKHAFDALSYAVSMCLLSDLTTPPPRPANFKRRMIGV